MDDFDTVSVYFNEVDVDLPYIFKDLTKKDIEIFSRYESDV